MNYEFRLTPKSIFFDRQTLWLFLVFVGLRAVSWLIIDHTILEGTIMFGVIMGFGVLYFKNPLWAWYVLIGEILLGGAGHFLNFFGLSLRSVLTITFLVLWLASVIGGPYTKKTIHIAHRIYYTAIPFGVFVIIAIITGISNNHNLIDITHDIVPFIYLALVLPAYHMFQEEHSKEFFVRAVAVYIIGNALFSLITFVLFSGGWSAIHGPFYGWFRDVAMGKITDMGTGFFRIVLPEHLLTVPISLIILSLLMKDESHHPMWRFLLVSCMLIIIFNFSRGYFLAFSVGAVILLWKHKLVEWIKESAAVFLIIFIIFTGSHIIASGFKSPGWELFGIRIKSIGAPSIEVSSETRMILLPSIVLDIQKHPFFGSGLGASVSYTDPKTFRLISTTQFDWGYLEMLAEFGILGTLAFLIFLIVVLYELIQKTRTVEDYHDFYVGLIAGLCALLIINITSPALFHVFGILFITLLGTYIMKPISVFDNTITILYRVFHRLSLPKFH